MIGNIIGAVVIMFVGYSLLGPIQEQISNVPEASPFLNILPIFFMSSLGLVAFSMIYFSLKESGLLYSGLGLSGTSISPDNRTPQEKFADAIAPVEPPNVNYNNLPSRELETAQV